MSVPAVIPTRKPETMAEALKLAYDAQQASDVLAEIGRPWERQKSGEEKTEETARYKINPKEGELTAVSWKPDGKNWTQTDNKVSVTTDTPFIATKWIYESQGSDGIELIFFSNDMKRDDEGRAIVPVWKLSIRASDLDNIRVIEENKGNVVSEWLGRHAVLSEANLA